MNIREQMYEGDILRLYLKDGRIIKGKCYLYDEKVVVTYDDGREYESVKPDDIDKLVNLTRTGTINNCFDADKYLEQYENGNLADLLRFEKNLYKIKLTKDLIHGEVQCQGDHIYMTRKTFYDFFEKSTCFYKTQQRNFLDHLF